MKIEFFRKKEYTLSEALRIISEDKNGKYTTVPVSDALDTKYFIEKTEKVQKRVNSFKPHIKTHIQQEDFRNRINGNGMYRNDSSAYEIAQKYNNYKSSKAYEKSRSIDVYI